MSIPERGTDKTLWKVRGRSYYFQLGRSRRDLLMTAFELYLKGWLRRVNQLDWQGHSTS